MEGVPLDTLQNAVGGHIERVEGDDTTWDCFVNDEGLLEQLYQNEQAAHLLHKILPKRHPQLFYGAMVFCFLVRAKESRELKIAREWFKQYQDGSLEWSDDDDEEEEEEVEEEKEEEKEEEPKRKQKKQKKEE
jgi:hypothetical protein